MKLGIFFIVFTPILYAATAQQEILPEQDVIDLMPYADITDVISLKNQKPMYNWVKTKTELTATNKKALLHLALGLDPKTGMQSGFVSLDAIKLISLNLQEGATKNAFEWMFDILTDVKTGMMKWNELENRNKLSSVTTNYPLLSLSVFKYQDGKINQNKNLNQSQINAAVSCRIRCNNLSNQIKNVVNQINEEIDQNTPGRDFNIRLKQHGDAKIYEKIAFLVLRKKFTVDLNGNAITEKLIYETAATYFRLAKTPGSYYNVGVFIDENHIKTDVDGNPLREGNRFEDAAKCYRLAKIPDSYYAFGVLIHKNKINTDIEGNPLREENRFKEAAKCYRESKTAHSYNKLSILIFNKQINTGFNEKPLRAEDRFEEIAKWYRESKASDAYYNLGVLIQNKQINTDLHGNPFHEDHRFEEAAKCYRLANTTASYNDLAMLIFNKQINTGFNGELFPEDNRFEEAAKCYRESKASDAYYNLGVLIQNKQINTDIDGNSFPEDNRFEEAAKCYRESKIPPSYYNLANLIRRNLITKDENNEDISIENKFLTIKRLYELSGDNFLALINLSTLYIGYDFGLTNEERLEKIHYLLRNVKSIDKFLTLAGAYEILKPSEVDQINALWERSFIEGINLSYLDLMPEKKETDETSSDLESDESSNDVFIDSSKKKTDNLSIEEQIGILSAKESEKRRDLIEAEIKNFESTIKRFNVGIEKHKTALVKKRRRIDLIKENIQPKMERDELKYTLKFTRQAYQQFQDLEKTGRERFTVLVGAIQNNEGTGNIETLAHEELVDGRRVMTRDLTQADRFAYTLDPETRIINVLSLKDHYKKQ